MIKEFRVESRGLPHNMRQPFLIRLNMQILFVGIKISRYPEDNLKDHKK